MRKLSEYENHVVECRQMAAKIGNPVHKKQLEQMADTWAMLADERRKHLLKQANRQQADLTRMAEKGAGSSGA
jgi:hypothetical protein